VLPPARARSIAAGALVTVSAIGRQNTARVTFEFTCPACVTSQSRIVLPTSNIANCTPGEAVVTGASNGSAGARCPCASAAERKARAGRQCQ
jgi:hypothetical protein